VEVALELLQVLASVDRMLWVVGGTGVVSENNSKGIKEPQVNGNYVTMEADNWHFHLGLDSITGVQFVEAESHGNLMSYYVRFSNAQEETLVRSYFPNPYLDEDFNITDLQPERLEAFERMRDRYVGREGIVFVRRTPQVA
jgi:putative heme iron utilization protein